MSFTANTQSLNPGEQVTLYRLDATKAKAGIHYFAQADKNSAGVTFGGQTYNPIDIKVSDFQTNAGGVLPTPKMQIGNSDDVMQGLVNTFGDLCGCELRRVRTFRRFLDGEVEQDGTAYVGPDVFRVERKSDENEVYIEWELSAAIDQEGKMLPGRQYLRDVCTLRYRIYDPTNPLAHPDGFVYPAVNPCPYTGAACFTSDGAATATATDACGYKVADCKLRFGADASLPFGGFPGIQRVPR
jgi:lambda family phage minor tail protein L